MDSDKTVSASFTPLARTLEITKAGQGNGTVTVTGNPVCASFPCAITAPHGTRVSATATPDANSLFTGFSGACSGSSCNNLLLDQDKSLTAAFDTKTDTTAPSRPANLAAVPAQTSVSLAWDNSTDPEIADQLTSGLKGYRLFRDNLEIAANVLTNSYADTGLTPDTRYRYAVLAEDNAGTTPPPSPFVNI